MDAALGKAKPKAKAKAKEKKEKKKSILKQATDMAKASRPIDKAKHRVTFRPVPLAAQAQNSRAPSSPLLPPNPYSPRALPLMQDLNLAPEQPFVPAQTPIGPMQTFIPTYTPVPPVPPVFPLAPVARSPISYPPAAQTFTADSWKMFDNADTDPAAKLRLDAFMFGYQMGMVSIPARR